MKSLFFPGVMLRGAALALAFPLFGYLIGGCITEDPHSTGITTRPILNGTPHSDHPSVVKLLINDNPDAGASEDLCSAVLVGNRTVLTAAHCLSKSPVETTAVRIDGERYTLASMHPHPGWNVDESPVANDIGIAILNEAPAVEQAKVSLMAPEDGMAVKIVGYGVSELSDDDPPEPVISSAGIKRIGEKTIHSVTDDYFTIQGSDQNSADADSGAPVFTTINDEEVIVGIVSASGNSYETSYDVRVDNFIEWLTEVSGGDVNTGSACTDCQPPVPTILSPEDGAVVSADANVNIMITVEHDNPIAKIECWVGETLAQTSTQSPYSCDIALEPGTQTIRVVAYDYSKLQGETQIDVTVFEQGEPDSGVNDASAQPVSGDDAAQRPSEGGCVFGRVTRIASSWLLLFIWVVLFVKKRRQQIRKQRAAAHSADESAQIAHKRSTRP